MLTGKIQCQPDLTSYWASVRFKSVFITFNWCNFFNFSEYGLLGVYLIDKHDASALGLQNWVRSLFLDFCRLCLVDFCALL